MQREVEGGKLNALALYRVSSGGEMMMSKEAAISEMKRLIERQRRELMRTILEESVIPKCCKEIFGHMSSVVHLFYSKDDGYWSMGLMQVATSIIHDPILLN